MTQSDFGTINPATKSGTDLASDLNGFRDAVNSNHAGSTRPSYVVSGMIWLDTTSSNYVAYLYDGSDDIPLFQIDATNNLVRAAIDADLDTYLISGLAGDDILSAIIAGTERFRFTAAGLRLSGNAPGCALDLRDKTDALLLPKGTEAQRPTPVSGMMRYNTDDDYVEYYNGTSWGPLGAAYDVQEFLASGTWTRPTDWNADTDVLYVEAQGGGGGGHLGSGNDGLGGAGGAGFIGIFDTRQLSDTARAISATLDITVGAGGAGGTGGGSSTDGGTTRIETAGGLSLIICPGGGAGRAVGTIDAAGGIFQYGIAGPSIDTLFTKVDDFNGYNNGGGQEDPGSYSSGVLAGGGSSVFGGGSGGNNGSAKNETTAGISSFAGQGGDGNNAGAGTDGEFPGGGGGAGTATKGGDGANGYVRITTIRLGV